MWDSNMNYMRYKRGSFEGLKIDYMGFKYGQYGVKILVIWVEVCVI